MKALLLAGADPKATTKYGHTALSIARELGYADIAEFLDRKRQQPQCSNVYGSRDPASRNQENHQLMTAEPTALPSHFYRTAVLQICTQYRLASNRDPDSDFYDYLQSNYENEKALLGTLLAEGDPPDGILTRDGQFIFAAGLLAYGHIEVAEDLLDFQPPTGGIRKLALALKALLPLPAEMDPLRDPEAVRSCLV